MGFTAEQRAKGLATRMANKAKADAKAKDAHVEITSTKDVPNEREKFLLDQIAEYKRKLGIAEDKLTAAEEAQLAAASSQGFGEIEEIPTGKTVTVKRVKEYKVVGHKDDGREIFKPVFKDVELPTFRYQIHMPPCGGTDLKINEVPFYHGAVYTVDIDTLRTIKEMVYRLWDHDRNIHGTDENAYRKKAQPRVSARGY
jgi:hypothetical protein